MSDTRANPSSFKREMYDCNNAFTFADGSSTLSFIGIGTVVMHGVIVNSGSFVGVNWGFNFGGDFHPLRKAGERW